MREIKFQYILKNKISGEIVKQVLTLDELQIGDCLLCGAGVIIYDVIAKRQYTGLKDKTGVEIYEGDVIELNKALKEQYEVIFQDGSFMYKATENNSFITKGGVWHIKLSDFDCEVIGNIYENFELLGGDNA